MPVSPASDENTIIRAPRVVPVSGEPDLEDTILTRRTIEPAEPTAPDRTGAGPAYYAFRLGESEPVLLDRPCTIGRLPSSPRIPTGVIPRLVRVHSPSKEVSASHLEIRQLGGSVVITDLRSTNGSIVMLPGSVPRKLRQGESVVVSPGTLVDIGDGNVLQILPMQRSGRVS